MINNYQNNIASLLKLNNNNKCCDCNKSLDLFIDQNNVWIFSVFGIFICLECAIRHCNFFPKFKKDVKPVYGNFISKEDIELLKTGGNNNFNNFLDEYDIPTLYIKIENKYLHKCVVYYINILHKSCLSTLYCSFIPLEITEERPKIKEGIKKISLNSLEKLDILNENNLIDKIINTSNTIKHNIACNSLNSFNSINIEKCKSNVILNNNKLIDKNLIVSKKQFSKDLLNEFST